MNHTNENILSYVDMLAGKRKSNIHASKSEYDHFDTPSFYVSENGSDDNDGTSPEKAWKSLEKANAFTHDKEANLLFERGGVWRGSLKVGANVTVSAYGEGEKPLFLGSPENGASVTKWAKVDGTKNVWRFCRELPDCGNIVFDDEKYAVRLMPKLSDGKFDFDVTKDFAENMTFVSLATEADGALYLRCDEGNPGSVFDSVEFAVKGDAFTACGDNVTVNNLAFKYYGGNGTTAVSGVKGFIVYMNEYKWIGGSVSEYVDGYGERYGSGDVITGEIERHFCDNCYFTEIFHAAMMLDIESPALAKKVIYSNNLVENCTFSVKYIHRKADEGKQIDDFLITSNILRHAGCGFGKSGHCEKCVPSHIKTCGRAENKAEMFTVKNNIMDRSEGQLVFISAKDASSLPRTVKNIYIQPEGKLFGAFGVAPVTPKTYENADQATLAELTNEYVGEFYFAE